MPDRQEVAKPMLGGYNHLVQLVLTDGIIISLFLELRRIMNQFRSPKTIFNLFSKYFHPQSKPQSFRFKNPFHKFTPPVRKYCICKNNSYSLFWNNISSLLDIARAKRERNKICTFVTKPWIVKGNLFISCKFKRPRRCLNRVQNP